MSLYGYLLRILYAYQHIGSHSTYLKTYRLLCHRYDLLSCATKWSFFSQRIGSLAVLFSQMTLVFYGKSILKAKQTLFVRENHFLQRRRSAKLIELFIFSSFSNATKLPKTVQSFSVQLYGRDLISAISYFAKYIQLET